MYGKALSFQSIKSGFSSLINTICLLQIFCHSRFVQSSILLQPCRSIDICKLSDKCICASRKKRHWHMHFRVFALIFFQRICHGCKVCNSSYVLSLSLKHWNAKSHRHHILASILLHIAVTDIVKNAVLSFNFIKNAADILQHSFFHIGTGRNTIHYKNIRTVSCHDLCIQIFQGICACHGIFICNSDFQIQINIRIFFLEQSCHLADIGVICKRINSQLCIRRCRCIR